MDAAEYGAYDALGLAALVQSGEIGAEEVLDAAIDAIDARNPVLNAVVARCDDVARADIARGLPDGPLRGVPYLIKDLNAHVAGLPSTQGVRLLGVYSLGLGVPFLATALMMNRFFAAMGRIRRHYHTIEIVSGLLLVVIGLLIFTNRFTVIAQWLTPYLPVY